MNVLGFISVVSIYFVPLAGRENPEHTSNPPKTLSSFPLHPSSSLEEEEQLISVITFYHFNKMIQNDGLRVCVQKSAQTSSCVALWTIINCHFNRLVFALIEWSIRRIRVSSFNFNHKVWLIKSGAWTPCKWSDTNRKWQSSNLSAFSLML